MLISVIIPTYNCEKYIKETILSVLNQSYPGVEIIIVDDGSTDGTLNEINYFKDRQSIKIIKNNHTGNVGKNRNQAIKASKGNMLAFIDGDDIWNYNKLELQIELLNEYDIVCSNSTVINDKGILIQDRYFDSVNTGYEIKFKDILENNVILTSSVLMKRSCIEKGIGFEEDFGYQGEDYYLWLKLLFLGKRVYFTNKQLVNYRKHSSGLTSRGIEEHITIQRRVLRYKECYLNTIGNNLSARKDVKMGIGSSHAQIGYLYYSHLHNYKSAVENYWKALKYCLFRSYKCFNYMVNLIKSITKFLYFKILKN